MTERPAPRIWAEQRELEDIREQAEGAAERGFEKRIKGQLSRRMFGATGRKEMMPDA